MASGRKRWAPSAAVRGTAQRVTAQGPVASAAASASAAPSVDVAATAEEMDLQLASHFLDLARMKLQAAGPNDPLANAEYVKAQAGLALAKAKFAQAKAEATGDATSIAHAEAKVAQAEAKARADVALADAKAAQAEAEVAQAEAKADVEWSRALGPTKHDLLLPRERAFLHTMRKVELAKAKVSLAEAKVAQTEALQGSVRSSMDLNGRVEKFQRTVAALEDQISEQPYRRCDRAVCTQPRRPRVRGRPHVRRGRQHRAAVGDVGGSPELRAALPKLPCAHSAAPGDAPVLGGRGGVSQTDGRDARRPDEERCGRWQPWNREDVDHPAPDPHAPAAQEYDDRDFGGARSIGEHLLPLSPCGAGLRGVVVRGQQHARHCRAA